MLVHSSYTKNKTAQRKGEKGRKLMSIYLYQWFV